MAAFSYQHQPFLLDSSSVVFSPPSPPIKVFGFLEEPNNTTETEGSFSSQFYPYHHHHQSHHKIPNHENGPKVALRNNNEPCVSNKQSTDSASLSAVVDYKPESSGEQVTNQKQKKKVTATTTVEKKRKSRDGSSLTSLHESMDGREGKGSVKKQKKCNGNSMRDHEKEKKPKNDNKKDQIKKDPREEAVPTGYIHVRARRGQATDSHSLAERVRREKISMRMKKLQSLVPGCDKVTGKAFVLDEIINYVQSLQNQVEFLSMKLASVNPMFFEFGMDLDAFMVTPEWINSMESPLTNVQQCDPARPTAFSDTTTTFTTTPSSYPLLDSLSSSSLPFDQHLQRPNFHPQENGQVLWDMDDQRQNLINQSGLSSNLCSFH